MRQRLGGATGVQGVPCPRLRRWIDFTNLTGGKHLLTKFSLRLQSKKARNLGEGGTCLEETKEEFVLLLGTGERQRKVKREGRGQQDVGGHLGHNVASSCECPPTLPSIRKKKRKETTKGNGEDSLNVT